MSLNQIVEYIKQCKLQHLDLDDEGIWSKGYLPVSQLIDNPGVYKDRVEFHYVHVWLIFPHEPLMICGPLPDWLSRKWCIYTFNNTDDSLCVWRCLAIFRRIRHNQPGLGERITRDALDLVRKLYGKLNIQVCNIRPTKLVDFGNTASRFRLYEPTPDNPLLWMLSFGKVQYRRSLLSVDIGLLKGHCFHTRNLGVLANHWECVVCQQRFSHHNNYNRHVTKKWCTGRQPNLLCDRGKFKCIIVLELKILDLLHPWDGQG